MDKILRNKKIYTSIILIFFLLISSCSYELEPKIVMKDSTNQTLANDASITLVKGASATELTFLPEENTGGITWSIEGGTGLVTLIPPKDDSKKLSVRFNTPSSDKRAEKNPAPLASLGILVGKAEGSIREKGDIRINLRAGYADNNFTLLTSDNTPINDKATVGNIYGERVFEFKVKEPDNAYPTTYTMTHNLNQYYSNSSAVVFSKKSRTEFVLKYQGSDIINRTLRIKIRGNNNREQNFGVTHFDPIKIISTDPNKFIEYKKGETFKFRTNSVLSVDNIVFNPAGNIQKITKDTFKFIKGGVVTITGTAKFSFDIKTKDENFTRTFNITYAKEPTIIIKDSSDKTLDNQGTLTLVKGSAATNLTFSSENAGEITWTLEENTEDLVTLTKPGKGNPNQLQVKFNTPSSDITPAKNPVPGTSLGVLVGKAEGSIRENGDIRINLVVGYAENTFELKKSDQKPFTSSNSRVKVADYIYGDSNREYQFSIYPNPNSYPYYNVYEVNAAYANKTGKISTKIEDKVYTELKTGESTRYKLVTLTNNMFATINPTETSQDAIISVQIANQPDTMQKVAVRYVEPIQCETAKNYDLDAGLDKIIMKDNPYLTFQSVTVINDSRQQVAKTSTNVKNGAEYLFTSGEYYITIKANLNVGSDKTDVKKLEFTVGVL